MNDLTPVNYGTTVIDPFQAAVQGYAGGAAIRDDQQNQALRAQQLEQQQAQQAQQQQVIQSLLTNPNPTATDYAHATLLVPGMKDQFKQSWDALNTDQQQAHLADTSQWYAAIRNGQPQLAVDAMTKRADAMDAATGGPSKQSQALRTQAQMIGIHPEFGATNLGMMLASIPGGDKVITSLGDLGTQQRASDQAPADLIIKNATAAKDVAGAQVAAATVPALSVKPSLDNAHTQQEIAASQAEQAVKTLNVQIAQANSETERGKLVLERDKWQQVADQTRQSNTASATGALDTLNSTRDTVSKLINHPGLFGLYGPTTGIGKGLAQISGTDQYDAQALLKTLQSQEFLSTLDSMKQTSKNGSSGMGALSNAEGDRLTTAIANLDPNQSSAQLKTSLTTILKTLDRAQAKLVAQGKLPGTTANPAGAVVMTHPTYGVITDAKINKLLQDNPGSTRDQAIQFLQQQAGQ